MRGLFNIYESEGRNIPTVTDISKMYLNIYVEIGLISDSADGIVVSLKIVNLFQIVFKSRICLVYI